MNIDMTSLKFYQLILIILLGGNTPTHSIPLAQKKKKKSNFVIGFNPVSHIAIRYYISSDFFNMKQFFLFFIILHELNIIEEYRTFIL